MKKLMAMLMAIVLAAGCGDAAERPGTPDWCELDWYSFSGEADCRVKGLMSNVYEAEVGGVLVTVVVLREAERMVFSVPYPDAVVTLVGEDGTACTSRNDTGTDTPPWGMVLVRDGEVVIEGYLTCPGGGWRYLRFVGPEVVGNEFR